MSFRARQLEAARAPQSTGPAKIHDRVEDAPEKAQAAAKAVPEDTYSPDGDFDKKEGRTRRSHQRCAAPMRFKRDATTKLKTCVSTIYYALKEDLIFHSKIIWT